MWARARPILHPAQAQAVKLCAAAQKIDALFDNCRNQRRHNFTPFVRLEKGILIC